MVWAQCGPAPSDCQTHSCWKSFGDVRADAGLERSSTGHADPYNYQFSLLFLQALPPPWPTTRPLKLYLSNLAVSPHFRRRGAAKQLLHSCERIGEHREEIRGITQ